VERPKDASFAAVPANDTGLDAATAKELAGHPPGCACAVHLAWRKKAVGAK
jgi:5-methyltetrahydrofolate--homocysteine methyltransferase